MRSMQRGFTLLEVLVAMTTIVVIIGLASASYSKFNRKETIKQVALTLKANLRAIQFKAINGQKPVNITCTQLDGYTITFATSSYTYKATCTPLAGSVPSTSVALPQGVSFSPVPSAILYKVLGVGTDKSSTVDITMILGAETYRVQVKPNGEIVDVGLQ